MKCLIPILALSMTLLAGARADLTVASLHHHYRHREECRWRKSRVIPIIKPGVDPHEFQPTPKDVKQIAKADLVLFTGKHIEGISRSSSNPQAARGNL